MKLPTLPTLPTLLRRRRPDADFTDEIQAHLALETDRLMAEGMSEAEARAAAHRAFGNVARVQERYHDSGRILWLDTLSSTVGSEAWNSRDLKSRPH